MKQLIVLIILSGVLSACSSSKKGHSFLGLISPKEKAIANDKKFIDAIKFKNSGDYEKSVELLKDILKSNEGTAPVHFELSKIYEEKGEKEKALSHINSAVNLNPKNKWYVNHKIGLTRKYALFEECEKTYLLRKKMFPSNTDYDIEFSDFYISFKKYPKALKLYEEIEEKIGVSEEINYNKFLIHKGLDDYEKTEAEIKKLIAVFPAESKYYVDYADFKLENGEVQKALEIYNQALEVTPEDPLILNELANYFLKDHQQEKAFDLYKKIIKDPSFNIAEKRHILRRFKRLAEANNDTYKLAKELMESAANTHPYDQSINLMAGDFMFYDRNYKDAVKFYDVVVDVKPNNYNAWIQLVLSYYNLPDYKKMSEKASEAMELFPTQPTFYFYSGMAAVQAKEYEKAIEILGEGNDLVVSADKKLKAQFLSSLGDVYHALGKHAKSDEYFELSLEEEPNNYYVLNNYAYYLSERNEKLDIAKKMSEKSNLLNPEEASFQDTYGWILYQLGDYENALNWLKKSELNGGKESAVINEHLGDVYKKLGKLEMAKKYWNIANEIGGGSDDLPKKLTE